MEKDVRLTETVEGQKFIEKYKSNFSHIGECIRFTIGWLRIVEKAVSELVQLCPSIYIVQIKEKFGELRIYTILPKDQVHLSGQVGEIVKRASSQSVRTCQYCGVEDNVTTNYLGADNNYLFTLCPVCRDQLYLLFLQRVGKVPL